VSAIIWTVCLLAFLGLFAWQAYNRIGILLKLPKAEGRLDRILERIKVTLVYGLGQLKFFRGEQPAGIIHAFVFWGFLVLGGQVMTMFLRGWAPDAHLPLMSANALGGPYMIVRDVMECIVIVCALSLLVRWLITHRTGKPFSSCASSRPFV
jgi:hypothetical protein